jgi:hypothetical protein
MTRKTETNELIGLTRISLKTTTIGETLRTSIKIIFIEKTFHSRVILNTQTKINVIMETKSSGIIDANVMVSNGRRIFRGGGECPLMFTSIDRRNVCSTVNREDILIDRKKMKITE